MSDPIVAEREQTSEGSRTGGGPIMVPRLQVTDEQKACLRLWAEDVCSAAGDVLTALADKPMSAVLMGDPPAAFTAAEGEWLKADVFMPTGSTNEPGQALVMFHESIAGALVDVAGGGDGTAEDPVVDEEGQQLLEEVMSQIVGVITREGTQVGTAVTWGGLERCSHQELAEIIGGGFAVAKFGLSVEDRSLGTAYTSLCKQALGHLASMAPQQEQPLQAAAGAAGGNGQGSVIVQSARFKPLDEGVNGGDKRKLDIIVDVPLQLTVELGRTVRKIKDVLALSPGAVVELDKLAGEAVDVLVNGKLVAKGEVVVIDENFGVRITDIVSPSERVSHIG